MVELAVTKLDIPREIAERKLKQLLKESSTIGFQMYYDLKSTSKTRQEKYKNWFYDN